MAWGIGGVPRPGSRATERPLLYLDVDGVLNPLSPSDPAEFVGHLREPTVDPESQAIRHTAGRPLNGARRR